MKKILKHSLQWVVCIIIGFLICNMLCFGYERPTGFIHIPNGASTAVWQPYSYMIHGTEGYSISKVDRNGYLNSNSDLADSYVLIMGSSHTQALEVNQSKKYSALVNDYISDDDKLHAYNIGISGSFLPSQIKHFKAATEAFPNAEVAIIEILSTDYSVDELEDAAEMAEFNANDSAEKFYELSTKGKVKNFLKLSLPMISKINKNIETIKKAKAGDSVYEVDMTEYSRVINMALSEMRSSYNGPIVFVYHPSTVVEEDGSVSLQYSKTWNLFKKACDDNDIDIIDSGQDFLDYYAKEQKLPYGFANTIIGSGHLNEVGHEIIAKEIIDYLEESKQ